MSSKLEKHGEHYHIYGSYIWYDYEGSKWYNLSNVYYPDNASTQSYPTGRGSTYRPSSLFFHMDYSFSDKYEVDNIYFMMNIKTTSANQYPSIKCYVGDSNAPYKKSPVCTVSTPYKKEDGDGKGYVHVFYKLTNVRLVDLKHLNVEVDWKKSSGSSEVRVGYGRIEVSTKTKVSGMSVSSSLSPTEINDYDGVATWKITVKQNDDSGCGYYWLEIPYDLNIDKISVSKGSLNGQAWKVCLKKGETATCTVKLSSDCVGVYQLNVVDNSDNLLKRGKIYTKNYLGVSSKEEFDDVKYLIYSPSYAEEEGYFELFIKGDHYYSTFLMYDLTSNIIRKDGGESFDILNMPLYRYAEVLDDSENIVGGLQEYIGEEDSKIRVSNSSIAFNLEHEGYYYLHLRIPYYSNYEGEVTLDTLCPLGESHKNRFYLLPHPTNTVDVIPSTHKQEQPSTININIGIPDTWTIRCESHHHNYYKINDDLLSLSVESLPAYIGSVQIRRCHGDDVTAEIKNTLIRDRYQNRAYYGKKGDTTESISMRLRIPPQDVATLEGFVEFDKPVPIDLIPTRWEGDPLNHRGWAELYEINNIKKINNQLYECEPVVEYLTHEINTLFTVLQGNRVYPSDTNENYRQINTFLTQTHQYGDKLEGEYKRVIDSETGEVKLEEVNGIMNVSDYDLVTDKESEDGYCSVYEIPSLNQVTYKSKKPLNNCSNWDIRFRNVLPRDDSEDYDNNWEMSLSLVDNDDTVLFEHLYHNFRHKDDNVTINTCDVFETVKNGDTYETSNYTNMSLNLDSTSPLINTNKGITKLSIFTGESELSGNEERKVHVKLTYDKGELKDKVLSNELLNITLTGEDYDESWTVMTNVNGVCSIPMDLPNGDYTLIAEYYETVNYISASELFDIKINYDKVNTEMIDYYDGDTIVVTDDYIYFGVVYDTDTEAGVPLTEGELYYSFTDIYSNNYNGASSVPIMEITETDEDDGEYTLYVARIPIKYNNGSKKLKVQYRGDDTYNPCVRIIDLNIQIPNNDYTIECDDLEFSLVEFRRFKRFYEGIIKYNDVPVNREFTMKFYNSNSSFTTTNRSMDNGVFSERMYLDSGLWNVDVNVANTTVTHTILIKEEKQDTELILSSKNLTNESFPQAFRYVTLRTVTGELLSNQLVNMKLKSDDEYNITIRTDDEGKVYCPFYWEYDEEDSIVEISFEGTNEYNSCSIDMELTAPSNNHTTSNNWDLTVIPVITGENTYFYLQFTIDGTPINGVDLCVYNEFSDYILYDKTQTINCKDNVLRKGVIPIPLMWGGGTVSLKCSFHDSQSNTKSELIPVGTSSSQFINSPFKFTITSSGRYLGYYGILKGDVSLVETTPTMNTPNLSISLIDNLNDGSIFAWYSTQDGHFEWMYPHSVDLYNVVNGYSSNNNCLIQPAPHLNTSSYSVPPLDFSISYNQEDGIVLSSKDYDKIGTIEVMIWNAQSMSNGRVKYESVLDDNGKLYINSPYKGDVIVCVRSKDVAYERILYCTERIFISGSTTLSNNFIENDLHQIIITPKESQDPQRLTFGSDVRFEYRDGSLTFYDFGMTENVDNNPMVKINSLSTFPNTEVYLKCEIKYNNSLNERLNNLEGLLQARVIENTTVDSNTLSMYKNMICSPSPVPNSLCYFTRTSEDGTLYYFKSTSINTNLQSKNGVSYLGSPFNQYKGGVDLQSSNGISLFNLNNGHSPVYLNNGLIRCGFHKYSGYVTLERYDSRLEDYIVANVLKISNDPKLVLDEFSYSDDKITLKFGKTEWTMWRGHPYVQVVHPKNNLRIMNEFNRVYCELTNEFNLGQLEEKDTYCGTFKPNRSVQLFKKEWNIGENILPNNFRAYEPSLDEISYSTRLDNEWIDEINDYSLSIKDENKNVNINFPTEGSFLEKPSSEFTFSIQYIKGDTPNKVMVRGFKDKSKLETQFTQEQVLTLNNEWLSATFSGVPTEIKYIDFILIYEDLTTSNIGKLMLNDGDTVISYEEDTTDYSNASSIIEFDKTYYVNIYNDYSPVGLSIMRPFKDSINFLEIPSSNLTILAPYLRNDVDINKPQNLLIEYVESHEQEVNIDSWQR